MLIVSQAAVKYNLAVINNNVRTFLRYLSENSTSFNPSSYIEHIGDLSGFPYMSIRDVLNAASYAGGFITAKMFSGLHIEDAPFPIIAIMKCVEESALPQESVQVVSANDSHVWLVDDLGAEYSIERNEFIASFTGMIICRDQSENDLIQEKSACHAFHIYENIIERQLLENIIVDFESLGFKDIKPTNYEDGQSDPTINGIVGRGRQSFLEFDLARNKFHALVNAVATDNPENCILEGVSCTKLSNCDRLISGFDSGINLHRQRAVHFPYREDDNPVIIKKFLPKGEMSLKTGDALVVNCGDPDGRIRWDSEWKLLQPEQGFTYIFSFWYRGV